MSETTRGNTFESIKIVPDDYNKLEFSQFVSKLYSDLESYKEKHFNYYNGLRDRSEAVRLRTLMAWIAPIAVSLATFGTAANLVDNLGKDLELDQILFVSSMIAFGLLGALAMFQRVRDSASSYFRSVTTIIAIRDLWTKFQFAFLNEELKSQSQEELENPKTRERFLKLASTFCDNLADITNKDILEWKEEFISSMAEVETLAKEGRAETEKQVTSIIEQVRETTKKMEKAAEQAKAAIEPALVNVTINGEFDNEVIISVNEKVVARKETKSFAISAIAPGDALIEATAKKGDTDLYYSAWKELAPGINTEEITLAKS